MQLHASSVNVYLAAYVDVLWGPCFTQVRHCKANSSRAARIVPGAASIGTRVGAGPYGGGKSFHLMLIENMCNRLALGPCDNRLSLACLHVRSGFATSAVSYPCAEPTHPAAMLWRLIFKVAQLAVLLLYGESPEPLSGNLIC